MKLIKTYTSAGVAEGYADLQTATTYRVGSPSRPAGEAPRYRVEVSQGEHFYHFLSPPLATREEAMAELDRLAALISGEAAPVGQGWVEEPPPLTPGAWFNVLDEDRNIHAVQCVYPESSLPWETAAAHPHASSDFTHHLPTPIQLPKEPAE